MTILLGFHLKDHILLAADSRVCWFPPGRPMQFRDEETKIWNTSIGLIAGSGLAPLLDAVKARFEDHTIHHTDDLVAIVREERQALETQPWFSNPRVQESLQTTCWMFTDVGAEPAERTRPAEVNLRLGISHPALGSYERRIIPPGFCLVVMPTGSTDEQVSHYTRWANEDVRTSEVLPDLSQSLQHHTTVAAKIIKSVSEWNPMVSGSFQIGVHSLWSGSGVSSVVSAADGQFTLSLSKE